LCVGFCFLCFEIGSFVFVFDLAFRRGVPQVRGSIWRVFACEYEKLDTKTVPDR
jgi:hypothetical protein